MACTECLTDCRLVDSGCIGQFTPLKGFTEDDLSACFHAANIALAGVTGDCDLCTGYGDEDYSYTAIIASTAFKGYYANLIYLYWLRMYGAGSPSKEGFRTKESDEYSQFRINTEGEINSKIERIMPIIEMYKTQFLETFKETFESCYDCSNDCTDTCQTCGNSCSGCTCKKVVTDGASLSIFGIKENKDYSTDDMSVL